MGCLLYTSIKGYKCFDVIRPQILNSDNTKWYYKQNTLLFMNENKCNLLKSMEPTPHPMMFFVQKSFENIVKKLEQLQQKYQTLEQEYNTLIQQR